jgi:hypothetical protein
VAFLALGARARELLHSLWLQRRLPMALLVSVLRVRVLFRDVMPGACVLGLHSRFRSPAAIVAREHFAFRWRAAVRRSS